MDVLQILLELLRFFTPLIYLGVALFLLVSAGASILIFVLLVARTGLPKIS